MIINKSGSGYKSSSFSSQQCSQFPQGGFIIPHPFKNGNTKAYKKAIIFSQICFYKDFFCASCSAVRRAPPWLAAGKQTQNSLAFFPVSCIVISYTIREYSIKAFPFPAIPKQVKKQRHRAVCSVPLHALCIAYHSKINGLIRSAGLFFISMSAGSTLFNPWKVCVINFSGWIRPV